MDNSKQGMQNYSAVKFGIQDLITARDGYAQGQAEGDSFLRDLLDLVSAARTLDADSLQDITDTLKAQYNYGN